MDLSLRLMSFGLEQRGRYIQPDRHDEYYEELLPHYTPCTSSTSGGSSRHNPMGDRECCCISIQLLGDQNAGKSAFLYSLVAVRDPMFTLLSSFLPIIQAEFSNRREMLQPHTDFADDVGNSDHLQGKAANAAAAAAITATAAAGGNGGASAAMDLFVSLCRDELPFLDSDVARAAALFTAEDFSFFAAEFIRTQQQEQQQQQLQPHHQHQAGEGDIPLFDRIRLSRYVLLHFLEFGGDHLDRMCLFNQLKKSLCCCTRSDDSRGCSNDSSNSSSEETCTHSSHCSKCDETAAAALLLLERDTKKYPRESAEISRAMTPPAATVTAAATAAAKAAATATAAETAKGKGGLPAAMASRLSLSLRRSFALAADAPLLVYFINCKTLFKPSVSADASADAGDGDFGCCVTLSPSSFLSLLLRLDACCSLEGSEGSRKKKRLIHFACSRLCCQSGAAAKTIAAETTAAAKRANVQEAAAEGCCCFGFDERRSFLNALKALKDFVSFLQSKYRNKTATATAATTAATEGAESREAFFSVGNFLASDDDILFSQFQTASNNTNNNRNSANCISNSNNKKSSWSPFEDCWGVSACFSLREEEERQQQCVSVSFLSRLLHFVWGVCTPLSFCRRFDFRGVSALRVLERNPRQGQQQQQQQLQKHQQQHAAWGRQWRLCVPSLVLFIARLVSLAAETETTTTTAKETEREGEREEMASKTACESAPSDTSRRTSTETEVNRQQQRETEQDAAASLQHQQLLQHQQQQQNILIGEMGRQLLSLFAACAHQNRQQQQQQGEVHVHLWLSETDWRDFVASFDAEEQQQLQQQQQEEDEQQQQHQQQSFTLPSTGEVVTVCTQQTDDLLLLPAAAAASAFSPLVFRLSALGFCLPCCLQGGAWAPLVLQLSIHPNSTQGDPLHLLLLPEALQGPLATLQQQQQLQQQAYVHQRDIERTEGSECFAAVRLPFHPRLTRLLDELLHGYAREPLPPAFWFDLPNSATAATSSTATATEEGRAAREKEFAAVSYAVKEAIDFAAGRAAVLLQQGLQQKQQSPEDEEATAAGNKHLMNALQVLLHLAGDIVLLHRMATPRNKTAQEDLQQQQNGWTCKPRGPFCEERQIFWTVALQSPPTSLTADLSSSNECSGVQTPSKQAVEALSAMLKEHGLVLRLDPKPHTQ